MKKLILISTLLMAGCVSWFVNDSTPAFQAKLAQTGQFLEVCDNFREIVSTATGLTPEQRSAILGKIAQSVEAYRSLEEPQLEYLKSVDGEEHLGLLRQSMELFLNYYNK